jgi:uncharacterized membrane protein
VPNNLYEALWIFILYACIGWLVEVSYAALSKGVFENRGFLNGPYCPIYGFGILIVTTLLSPLQDNLIWLFLGSVALTSALEFLTGLVLEKIFKQRWWDYSDVPFNIMGHICLKFSVFWGLGCMFVLRLIHPHILTLIQWCPGYVGNILLFVSLLWLLVDCAATIDLAWDERNNLKVLEESAKGMRKISDNLAEGVYKGATKAAKKVRSRTDKTPEDSSKTENKK